MPFARAAFAFILRIVAAAMVGLAGAAWAQPDPPARVGRLATVDGNVSFAPAGDNDFIDAELNRPLVAGDRLWTDKGSRAEVQVGSAWVRMDGLTQLEVMAIDDRSAQFSVRQGSVAVRVRALPEGENFEIDTPNLAYRAAYPGDLRIDVHPGAGTTRVTILAGAGAVYGANAQAIPLGGGQQVTFRQRDLTRVDATESPAQDAFDRWAAERNGREEQSVAARYLSRDVVGASQLDAHGQWQQDAKLGPVWVPQGLPANWAPYRHGRWDWIEPWGWTWIDEAPWAFAPSHYGRWTLLTGNRWAWVPGHPGLRPVYAPALVAFVGQGGPGLPSVGGKPGIAWFPLAPGEAWQPGFRATPLYVSSVNANMPPLPAGEYAFQRKPEALTALSMDDFQRGRPVKGNSLRVAQGVIDQAQVVPRPPMPERASAAAGPPDAQAERAGVARQVRHEAAKRSAAEAKSVADTKAAAAAKTAARTPAVQQRAKAERAPDAKPSRKTATARKAQHPRQPTPARRSPRRGSAASPS